MATSVLSGVLGLDTHYLSNSNQLVMRHGAEDFITHTFGSPETNNPLGTLMLIGNVSSFIQLQFSHQQLALHHNTH